MYLTVACAIPYSLLADAVTDSFTVGTEATHSRRGGSWTAAPGESDDPREDKNDAGASSKR